MFDLKYFEGHRKMAYDALDNGDVDWVIWAMVSALAGELDTHLPFSIVQWLLTEKGDKYRVSDKAIAVEMRKWLDGLDLNEYADYYKNYYASDEEQEREEKTS